jgi:acyl carrier protein
MLEIPSHDVVEDEITRFIISHYMPGEAEGALRPDDLLFEGGIIDSGGALEFVNFLERRYRFRVRDDELFLENFATVERVVSFVLKRLGQGVERTEVPGESPPH